MRRSVDPPRRSRAFRAAAVLAFWTLVGLASGVQSRVLAGFEGQEVSVLDAIVRSVPPWWFWAVVTPGIAWMARRYPLDGNRWPLAVGAHLGGAVAAAALHALWLAAFFHALGVTTGMTETTAEYVRLIFLSRLYIDIITYSAVLGAVHAFDYHDRLRERELRESRLEAQLARARLDALRMQLNPHFLFNALNAVAAQVRAGRGPAATSMLSGLGDLLRYVLESGEDALVPLRREAAFLERYVEIERVRFADRLTVTIDVPPDLGDARIPSLLLQPLVENAVRHGIAPREAPGRVEVTARREDARLVLRVWDDGVWIAGPRDGGGGRRIGGEGPRPGGDGTLAPRDGVGLANTRARLEELYGPDHDFEVRSGGAGGTEVRIAIPWRVHDRSAPDAAPPREEGA